MHARPNNPQTRNHYVVYKECRVEIAKIDKIKTMLIEEHVASSGLNKWT